MKDVTLSFAPPPTITVNGLSFALKMDVAEIFETAALFPALFEKTKDHRTMEVILGTCELAKKFIDQMLGRGAYRKITGKKPLKPGDIIALMNGIATSATQAYAENVDSYA